MSMILMFNLSKILILWKTAFSLRFVIIPKKGLDTINKKAQSKDERLEDIELNLQHFNEIANRVGNALDKFGCKPFNNV